MNKFNVNYAAIVIIFCSLLTSTKECDGKRILAIFPIPIKEQQLIYRPLIETLAKRNHEIVLMTTDPFPSENYPNIHQIDLSFAYNLNVLDKLKDSSLDGSGMLKAVFNVIRQICEAVLKSKDVKELIQNSEMEKFDTVLVEWSGSSLMSAFAYKFNAPLIGITNGGAFLNSLEAFGNPNHPTIYPNIFMPFQDNLNLLQRISSVVFTVWYRYFYFNEEIPQQNLILQEHFGEETPSAWDIECNADLLLINDYEELGNIRPTVPTTIYLGGIHQQTSSGNMSTELDLFLRESTNVVYVNLNSGIYYYSNRLDKLLGALEALNVDIVWNWNSGDLINTSSRIYQSSDLPQEDILAHPKTRLFVTDGGQRNIEDAVHNDVPVFGISYTTSTEHYLREIRRCNAGTVTHIDFESKTSFADIMYQTINGTIYQENMNNLKRLILDKPMSSMDRAVWWIEYVMRHNGTKNLQTTKNISWFQYFMLDVILTLAVIFVVILGILVHYTIKLRNYSKSLPFEKITNGSRKCKVL